MAEYKSPTEIICNDEHKNQQRNQQLRELIDLTITIHPEQKLQEIVDLTISDDDNNGDDEKKEPEKIKPEIINQYKQQLEIVSDHRLHRIVSNLTKMIVGVYIYPYFTI